MFEAHYWACTFRSKVLCGCSWSRPHLDSCLNAGLIFSLWSVYPVPPRPHFSPPIPWTFEPFFFGEYRPSDKTVDSWAFDRTEQAWPDCTPCHFGKCGRGTRTCESIFRGGHSAQSFLKVHKYIERGRTDAKKAPKDRPGDCCKCTWCRWINKQGWKT